MWRSVSSEYNHASLRDNVKKKKKKKSKKVNSMIGYLSYCDKEYFVYYPFT